MRTTTTDRRQPEALATVDVSGVSLLFQLMAGRGRRWKAATRRRLRRGLGRGAPLGGSSPAMRHGSKSAAQLWAVRRHMSSPEMCLLSRPKPQNGPQHAMMPTWPGASAADGAWDTSWHAASRSTRSPFRSSKVQQGSALGSSSGAHGCMPADASIPYVTGMLSECKKYRA